MSDNNSSDKKGKTLPDQISIPVTEASENNNQYTPEEQEFIKKIRGQLSIEDDESSMLLALLMLKNIP